MWQHTKGGARTDVPSIDWVYSTYNVSDSFWFRNSGCLAILCIMTSSLDHMRERKLVLSVPFLLPFYSLYPKWHLVLSSLRVENSPACVSIHLLTFFKANCQYFLCTVAISKFLFNPESQGVIDSYALWDASQPSALSVSLRCHCAQGRNQLCLHVLVWVCCIPWWFFFEPAMHILSTSIRHWNVPLHVQFAAEFTSSQAIECENDVALASLESTAHALHGDELQRTVLKAQVGFSSGTFASDEPTFPGAIL